jgi:hypothetical protein
MERVVHAKSEYMVLQVQSILFALVVRKEIQIGEVGLWFRIAISDKTVAAQARKRLTWYLRPSSYLNSRSTELVTD